MTKQEQIEECARGMFEVWEQTWREQWNAANPDNQHGESMSWEKAPDAHRQAWLTVAQASVPVFYGDWAVKMRNPNAPGTVGFLFYDTEQDVEDAVDGEGMRPDVVLTERQVQSLVFQALRADPPPAPSLQVVDMAQIATLFGRTDAEAPDTAVETDGTWGEMPGKDS